MNASTDGAETMESGRAFHVGIVLGKNKNLCVSQVEVGLWNEWLLKWRLLPEYWERYLDFSTATRSFTIL